MGFGFLLHALKVLNLQYSSIAGTLMTLWDQYNQKDYGINIIKKKAKFKQESSMLLTHLLMLIRNAKLHHGRLRGWPLLAKL